MTDYIAAARKLTPRQVEMLTLIADGLSNAQVAAQLFVSVNTVKSTLELARARLKAKSTAHAVALALRSGEIR